MPLLLRRILLGLAVVLVLIFSAGFLFARFWLDDYAKEKLISAVDRSSRQMYALQIDQLHINIFTGSAAATGVQIRTDSLRWEDLRREKPESTPLRIDLTVNSLAIRHFNLWRYWGSKDVTLNSIEIVEPQLKLASEKDSVLEKNPQTDTITKSLLDRLPQIIAPQAHSLHIGSVEISNGKIVYQTIHQRKKTYQQADSIHWLLSNMNIVPSDTSETGKALYAENILLTLHNYEFYPPGGVYGFRFRSAEVVGSDSVKIMNASILPLLSDGEFMQRLTIRKPRLRVRIKEIMVRKLNLFRALHKQEWTMESVVADRANFDIFQDKNLPPKLNKRMPHELVQDLTSYLNIDTFTIKHSHILYTEVIEEGKGLLEFDNINGVVLNVTNDKLRMTDTTPARIYARAELMGAGLLEVNMSLPLLARHFDCNYVVTLGKMNMIYLNRLLTDKDHLRVESGDAQKIVAKVNVQNSKATGTLEATYDNLELTLLKKDGRKKAVMSALANLLIRGKNSRTDSDRPFKIGEIEYEREPADGFIRFLWRSAQTGLMKTLVPGNIKIGKKRD